MCTHLEPFVHILMFLSGKLWAVARERESERGMFDGWAWAAYVAFILEEKEENIEIWRIPLFLAHVA